MHPRDEGRGVFDMDERIDRSRREQVVERRCGVGDATGLQEVAAEEGLPRCHR